MHIYICANQGKNVFGCRTANRNYEVCDPPGSAAFRTLTVSQLNTASRACNSLHWESRCMKASWNRVCKVPSGQLVDTDYSYVLSLVPWQARNWTMLETCFPQQDRGQNFLTTRPEIRGNTSQASFDVGKVSSTLSQSPAWITDLWVLRVRWQLPKKERPNGVVDIHARCVSYSSTLQSG